MRLFDLAAPPVVIAPPFAVKLAGRFIGLSVQLEQRIQEARAGRENEGWIPPEARREATTGQEIGPERETGRDLPRRRPGEAENSPVEGRDAGTGETTPREPEAIHGPPEAAHEPAPAQAGESTPSWTKEERQARIDAERERQEQNSTVSELVKHGAGRYPIRTAH